jgi:hypothetical protein
VVADRGVLAYVFWHAPAEAGDVAAYEEALVAFHAVLRDAPPSGFAGSAALRVTGAPWLPGASGYEDWYLVEDFRALGELNEAAVSGRRQGPHDDVALRSGHGAGGVYTAWVGAPDVPTGDVLWFAKAPGRGYGDLRAALPGTTWQRQLVLGPAPEFCRAGGPVPPGATPVATTSSEVVYPASHSSRPLMP